MIAFEIALLAIGLIALFLVSFWKSISGIRVPKKMLAMIAVFFVAWWPCIVASKGGRYCQISTPVEGPNGTFFSWTPMGITNAVYHLRGRKVIGPSTGEWVEMGSTSKTNLFVPGFRIDSTWQYNVRADYND